ncbi:EAL domain-containing protein [Fusibacter ferrireducens]|uniref:GGDEF domain-containing protein n=1 Tax=Fusibacter ferrireducens TaxID=2785058 RepID=A0ABR9ZU97_9FIRM|nr:EAL domain-containing protein [Fusibacter ferrireducens]MBF4694022.1 GGDEF domain-containing protein [Fusibacter ferrireducens]
MTDYIEFILKLLMSYGLIFLLTYYVIVILNRRIAFKSQVYYIGFLIALIACFQIYAMDRFGYRDIPDGRFFLTGLATYFWGITPGVIIAFIISIFKYMVYGIDALPNLILFGVNIIFFKCGKVFIEKYKINEHVMSYFFLSSASILCTILVGSFVLDGHISPLPAIEHYISVLLLGAFTVSALFFMVKRELDEIDLIDSLSRQKSELLEQKIEIQALYEEMLASEETLKSNYDELKRYQEKVEFLAFHESQTGFSNKEHLYQRLRERQKNNSKILLLLAVKDRGKLNYTLGNTIFEMLHFIIGAEIHQYFEPYSTNELYSLGSGLYAVLITMDISEADIDKIFNRLYEIFLKNELINSMGFSLSLEVGAVHLNRDTIEPEVWVEYAESALLMSGHLSGDSKIVWFKNSYYEQLQATSYLVTNLKKAIANAEFYVVYQPKFDQNSQLKSAEALIRWHHPENGEIEPYTFIPLAEMNGVVAEIGEFVMQSVCDMIKTVEARHLNCIPIAINASILEILNPQYSGKVFQTFEENGIEHSNIQIEVTESAISESYEDVIRTLTTLSNGGVEIHLDDFGTGYSSLSHIGIMPIAVIKIDKKFIDQIFVDEKYENLIEMMIDFSHRSNIKVVAEGVENEAQFNWLKERHCDYYQGYYFSKPISKEDLMELIQIYNG